jgi:hypothetical protein
MRKMKHMKGNGIFEDIDSFLKKSKILSNVGKVLLPIGGGLLGTAITANPAGTAVGTALGASGAEFLKAQGYGKMMRGCGKQFSRTGVITNNPATMMGSGGNQTRFNTVASEYGKVKF